MTLLVILGVVLVSASLAGLGYCIREGFRVRREKPAPEIARARLRRLVAVNLGSMGLAAFGLVCVVLGVILS